jgi:hypothetical protein
VSPPVLTNPVTQLALIATSKDADGSSTGSRYKDRKKQGEKSARLIGMSFPFIQGESRVIAVKNRKLRCAAPEHVQFCVVVTVIS